MKKILSKYNWHRGKELSCCGFILEGDKHLTGKGMEDYLITNSREKGIETTLRMANGRFAVIGKIEDSCVAACDRLRTYPLFYCKHGNNILVSDSAHLLLDEVNNPSLNKNGVEELLRCGFTLINETLINEIKQVQAGEYISYDKGLNTHEYHNFTGYFNPDSSHTEPGFTLPGILEEVFRTNLSALNNKPVVLPLSGGYDSRLIAVMLKKYHRGKVITFTYGSENSPEFKIASKVAKKLNLEWIPVVYNNKLTCGYITDKTFHSFYKYSSELSSIFFFQDYFAVKYLNDNNLVPSASVFIPGHTGDILSGGHISPGQNRVRTTGNNLFPAFRFIF